LGILSCVRDGTWMWYEVADDLPDWCQDILDITYEQITPRGTSRDVSDLA
jgi:ArsR family transcriptional regulator